MLSLYKQKESICLNYTTEPNVLAGLNGLTVLKNSFVRSRFSGSKKLIVDRNGCLQEKQKKIQKKTIAPQKKSNQYFTVNKKRVVNILQNLIASQTGKKQLYFYTISFPPCIPDNVAYKCLNSWLTSLRYAYSLQHYLWVAERQQIGTIHFHIAIPHFLPIKLINGLMKKLLHYYIRNQELRWNHLACSKYNGIDISKNRFTKKVINFASQKNGKALANYMSKYMTKSNIPFKRQAWQCSKSLSALFTKYAMTKDEFSENFLDYIEREKPLIISDFFFFYTWKTSPPPEIVFMLRLVNTNVLQRYITR